MSGSERTPPSARFSRWPVSGPEREAARDDRNHETEGALKAAVYAGDDTTDLDAFRRLRELRDDGSLETAICVGVTSPEAPTELAEKSDLTVDGPAGWLAVLDLLGELAVPYTDLLRTTVFLTGAEATALGALAHWRRDDDDTRTIMLPRSGGRSRWRRPLPRQSAPRTASAMPWPRRARPPRSRPNRPAGSPSAGSGRSASPRSPGVSGVLPRGRRDRRRLRATGRPRVAEPGSGGDGLEHRDGTRFYVVPGSAFRPVQLVRTPGLGSDVSPAPGFEQRLELPPAPGVRDVGASARPCGRSPPRSRCSQGVDPVRVGVRTISPRPPLRAGRGALRDRAGLDSR